MLSKTVQHPIIMYIAAAILISKTCSLYQNYNSIVSFLRHKIQKCGTQLLSRKKTPISKDRIYGFCMIKRKKTITILFFINTDFE
jgi:hypothetical protein